jgi:hypothetical protein
VRHGRASPNEGEAQYAPRSEEWQWRQSRQSSQLGAQCLGFAREVKAKLCPAPLRSSHGLLRASYISSGCLSSGKQAIGWFTLWAALYPHLSERACLISASVVNESPHLLLGDTVETGIPMGTLGSHPLHEIGCVIEQKVLKERSFVPPKRDDTLLRRRVRRGGGGKLGNVEASLRTQVEPDQIACRDEMGIGVRP